MRFGRYKSRKNKKRAAIAKRQFIVSECDRSEQIMINRQRKEKRKREANFIRRFTGGF